MSYDLGEGAGHHRRTRRLETVAARHGFEGERARKALAAVLEAQGLRATATGGHVVLQDAMEAQFEPPLGHLFKPFNRMRMRRNQAEYASMDNPEVTAEEVLADLVKARGLVEDFAAKAIDLVS
ncbi:hypothetical protein [Ornithinibacter aureus]|nr:hypothetical protein [Ornithinibacter aureus]